MSSTAPLPRPLPSRSLLTLGGALLLALAGPAHAVDWSLSGGLSEKHSVKKAGIIAGWNRAEPLWAGQKWELALRHELELAYWDVPKAKDNIIEAGYSPILRFQQRATGDGARFFAEASIGLRLLSHTHITPTRTLSTAFQFSDVIGAGVQWGPQARSTLGVRIQHLSNAGIKRPNPGINFAQIYYTHRF
ncbi:MAG: acyloxyacyl hydrolase [Brachymonas sp.]|nr:acyloxyacyl hydrolase [Brachymonas sp.]